MPKEDNLMPPWKPGQSGNPKGNQGHSTKSFKARLTEMLDREIDYKALDGSKSKMKCDEAILTALMAKAMFKQDTRALQILIEMNDGKPHQATDITSKGKRVTLNLPVFDDTKPE